MQGLAENLKQARILIGFTILQASKESGLAGFDIGRFERGTDVPTFSQLHKLAEAYKIEVSVLWSDEPIRS